MNKNERNIYILFINDNIDKLDYIQKKNILQMIIFDDNTEQDKIKEKGSETQICYSDIDDNLLTNIYNYIKESIMTSI